MKHPAEDNVLKLRATEKVVEQVSDIALHHLLCFAGDQEWTHIPAPVAVKEYVPREYFLQFAARRGFANARRAADDDEVFHIAAHAGPAGSVSEVIRTAGLHQRSRWRASQLPG